MLTQLPCSLSCPAWEAGIKHIQLVRYHLRNVLPASGSCQVSRCGHGTFLGLPVNLGPKGTNPVLAGRALPTSSAQKPSSPSRLGQCQGATRIWGRHHCFCRRDLTACLGVKHGWTDPSLPLETSTNSVRRAGLVSGWPATVLASWGLRGTLQDSCFCPLPRGHPPKTPPIPPPSPSLGTCHEVTHLQCHFLALPAPLETALFLTCFYEKSKNKIKNKKALRQGGGMVRGRRAIGTYG